MYERCKTHAGAMERNPEQLLLMKALQIIRCIRRDIGSDFESLLIGAKYCERISWNSERNPWAECDTARDYKEAAAILRKQAKELVEMKWTELEAGIHELKLSA